jgi:hypothetical protein
MADPTGVLHVKANGVEYKLHLGWSVLAELQGKHGQEFLGKLSRPDDASETWMPDLAVVVDVVEGSLQRYHADAADQWLVDDILRENSALTLIGQLVAAAFPDQKPGKQKRPRAAA